MDGVGVIMEDKIELLRDIIENSKTFEFVEDNILNVKDYYTGRKSINIDFKALIEMIEDCEIEEQFINSFLLTDEELDRNEDY